MNANVYSFYQMAEDGAFNAILDVLQDEVNEGDSYSFPFVYISEGCGQWEMVCGVESMAWTKGLINFICHMVAEGFWEIDTKESRALDYSRKDFPDYYVWVCLKDEYGRKITLKMNSNNRLLEVFGLSR